MGDVATALDGKEKAGWRLLSPGFETLSRRLPIEGVVELDGIEVLRRIRDDSRTKSIPVVVLTSSQEERDIAECYKLGVNSYIVKPVEFDQFYKTVSDIGMYWLVLNKSPL